MGKYRGTLDLAIEKTAREPIYQQLVEQIAARIADGILTAGDRLPPVRALSRQIAVNQMTVAKAYKALAARGLVEGRSGGGTTVCRYEATAALRREEAPRADWAAERLQRWDVQSRIAELSRAPGVIAFTGGCPGPKEVDVERFIAAIAHLQRGSSDYLFAYSASAGLPDLREALARLLSKQEMQVDPDHVIVTSGAQQALDLTARTLLGPGDVVAVERPCYFGSLDVFRAVGARIVGVPMEEDGIDLAALEAVLRRGETKLISLIPTFQNPTGITMSLEKRLAVLALARRYGVPILEDDYCPEMRYAGEDLPPLRKLAESGDEVIYVRGLGKVYLPGIRIGFLVAPPSLRSKLLLTKSLTDLHTSTILQKMVAEYLATNHQSVHAATVSRTYAKRHAQLCDALEKHLPRGARFRRPAGGFNLWVTLPERIPLADYYFKAVQSGVAFTLGDLFYADEPDGAALRVSFGAVKPADLVAGAQRIGQLANALLEPSSRAHQPVLV